MTVTPGRSMIFQGDETAIFSGTLEGRHRLLGSSLPRLSIRFLYSAAAHGWNGTSFRSAAMLIRYFSPGSIHTPDRSGLPSGLRGAGAVRFAEPSLLRGIPLD